MKLPVKPRIRGIIKDSLSVFPREYFCILNRESALFLKITGKKNLEWLLKVQGDSSSIQFLKEFFTKLTALNEYYGQPITILINNTAAFSYIKFLGEQRSSQVLESVKHLQNEDLSFSQAVRSDTKAPLFVSQGINKAFLSTIETLAHTYKLPILEIVSLPVYLTLNLPAAQFIRQGISVFQFEKTNCLYLLWDKFGNVVPGQMEIAEDKHAVSYIIKKLTSEFFANEAEVSIFYYAFAKSTSLAVTGSLRMATVLRSGGNKSQKTRKFLFKPKTVATSRVIVTALNSARLLIVILGVVCVLSLLAAGISTIITSGNDSVTDNYQSLYSNTLTLQSEMDSLNQINNSLIALQPGKLQAAELLSNFCQKRYNGIYLTQFSINKTPSDSVRIDARGVSRKESGVFTYHQHLNNELRPLKLTLNSLKPEIQNTGEKIDTFFVFNFGALINENRPNR